jgi:hypothetical protein
MKKTILFVAMAVCLSTGAMAQGISGGIKAGLNFANQKFGSDVLNTSADSRTSWHAGLFLTIKAGSFGVQPEVLYNSVGAEFDAGDVRKIDYVSIPVMIRFNFAKIVNIHAGPQFGMLLSAKDEDIDIKEELKSTDLGIGAGIGLDIPMGLTASVRYVFGISDINDSNSDFELKNNVMQVSVGYKLFGK